MTALNHYFVSSILGGRIEGGVRSRFGFLGSPQILTSLKHRIEEAEMAELALAPGDDARIAKAFEETRQGYSPDVVLSTPELSTAFFGRCRTLGVTGARTSVNRRLMRFRKSPPPGIKLEKTTRESDARPASYVYAAEIAATQMRYRYDATIDDLLISPEIAAEFVSVAQRMQSGGRHLDYVSAALHVRKNRKPDKTEWARIKKLQPRTVQQKLRPIGDFSSLQEDQVPIETGLFVISERVREERSLYVGAGKSVRTEVIPFRDLGPFMALGDRFWVPDPKNIWLSVAVMDQAAAVDLRGWQCRLITDLHPVFNYPVREVA